MDPSRSYPSSSLEDQLRHMIMTNGNPQHQSIPQYQVPGVPGLPIYSHIPPPPGFHVAPSLRHQQNFPSERQQGFDQFVQQQSIPTERQQGFDHFLQQHQVNVNMPGPHRPPPGFQNDMRNQGPRTSRPMDPNDFHRPGASHDSRHASPQHQRRQLYHPQSQQARPSHPQSQSQSQPQLRPSHPQSFVFERQWQYLAAVADQEIPRVQMTPHEVDLKDAFRVKLQQLFENLKSPDSENPLPSVLLQSFGSLSSGFATADSDMDLAIVTSSENNLNEHFSSHEHSLPRVLEKELLNEGYGARLLTRTRVPIIKICEEPPPELLKALQEARTEWDNLPESEKYASSKTTADDTLPKGDVVGTQPGAVQNNTTQGAVSAQTSAVLPENGFSSLVESTDALHISQRSLVSANQSNSQSHQTQLPHTNGQAPHEKPANRQRNDKNWRREKTVGPLDFPKQGVGIQCDINFFNPLGIHNTKMLRCYSKCDSRVKPMVLFVKAWAKRRKINSSYSGTLSSYGYVLMVLHYLVNVANPPVLPNLQHEAETNNLAPTEIDGFKVRFFDDENIIENRAREGLITQNHEPLGMLLCGFFQYYAQTRNGYGFVWTQDVLSLRTAGGTLTKQEKGWTGAKTEVGENKEVRHRYLFAIEDPFETSHNVARTVTHNGICAIRDEFRRTWRILTSVGRGMTAHDGELFAELQEVEEPVAAPATVPPPVVTKPKEYTQQFPSLGAAPMQTPTSMLDKAASQATTLTQPAQVASPVQVPAQVSAQESTAVLQNDPAPAARGKGRRQKFVPLNMEATGEISGDRARAHLEQFKRHKQMGV